MKSKLMTKGFSAALMLLALTGGWSLVQPVWLYAAPKPAEAVQSEPMVLVNINQATAQDLVTVRGIGPAIAERILAFRQEHGPFKTVDELVNVTGIGGAKLQKIKAQVAV